MAIVDSIDHVQITVSPEDGDATLSFYASVLGLRRIPKPNDRPGAWFACGSIELHVGVEPTAPSKVTERKRHVCFVTSDLGVAESALRAAEVAITRDDAPTSGWRRFYVRDPGGNRIEIACAVPTATR